MVRYSREVKQRYHEILKFLMTAKDGAPDEEAIELLSRLVDKASRYVERVVHFEMFYKRPEMRERMEQARAAAHNALISALTALNRYIIKEYLSKDKKYSWLKGGILPEGYALALLSYKDWQEQDPRRLIGDWAWDLVHSLGV